MVLHKQSHIYLVNKERVSNSMILQLEETLNELVKFNEIIKEIGDSL
jgi:transcription elongation factor